MIAIYGAAGPDAPSGDAAGGGLPRPPELAAEHQH